MLRYPRAVVCVVAAVCASTPLVAQQTPDSIVVRYREAATRIIQTALADSSAHARLGRLVDTFGPRFSGSTNLEQAIDWMLAEMRTDGLANVRTEPVKVPHWIRGEESAQLVSPRRANLPMLGLGGSVGTPRKGVTAEVLVVSSFDELTAKQAEARGKIVLFDAPFTDYGHTVLYRRNGAVAAARAGAVAALIRTVAPYSIRSPHTGSTQYDDSTARIPIAALTLEDAMMLHRMQDRGDRVVLTLRMEAQTLPDADSRNIIAELIGSEYPDQVIVMGGHIDSWDVGQGAMDDGGGIVAAWEAVHLLKRLGFTPRRTIRVVGWTNEENGLRGGRAYRDAQSAADLSRTVMAFESDNGPFRPRGVGFTGSDAARATLQHVVPLLAPLAADTLFPQGGEADIGPLIEQGVPGMSLLTVGDRYFWYHHSQGDTLDKVDPAELARCVAVMAIMAYVVADLPEPLPR